jgi:hypothetical protein
VPSGEAWCTPVDGRDTPDSSVGTASAQTLKSLARSLNGEVLEQVLARRARSCFELLHVGLRIAVAQDQQVDLLRRWPADADRIGLAGAGGCLRTTSMALVSTSTVQTTEKALRSSRLRMRTRTGWSGLGKRTDSWKPRLMRPASSVLRHSPNTVEKPREYSNVAGLRIHHFHHIVAAVGVVEGAAHVARPRQRFDHHALERVVLVKRVAAVE